MTDDLWFRQGPFATRDRTGTSRAGWVGLALVVLWIGAFAVCLHGSDAAVAADRAATVGLPRDALADPPTPVARADFVVGLVGISALPVAVAVVLLGYRGVLLGWRSGRGVGWVALVTGGVGLLPALVACLSGLLTCWLVVGVVVGA